MRKNLARMYSEKDVFTPGVLTNLFTDVMSGKPANDIRRLSTNQMNRIPELYSIDIDYSPEVLFDRSILDVIDPEKIYTTANKKEVLGADVKAMTLLMYMAPRTAYWKPEKSQVHNTSVCGAVPLPLLGFRNFRKIPYNAWNTLPSICEDSLRPELYEDDDSDFNLDLESLNQFYGIDILDAVYKQDLLLGKTLASTEYNGDVDEVQWIRGYGLVLLSVFKNTFADYDYSDVTWLREHNMGNHRGSFATAYGTANVPEGTWDDSERNLRATLHNRCSTPMRLMLSQRWAWYGKHRNNNMICYPFDWDTIPKDVDNMSVAFKGKEPSEFESFPSFLLNKFGITK